MKIANSFTGKFGGYELDHKAITLHSMSEKEIRLPYHGKLPAEVDGAGSSHVFLRVSPIQRVRAVLVVDSNFVKPHRYALELSTDEMIALLDGFFFTAEGCTRFDNGLNDYWLGSYQAEYITWKSAVQRPYDLRYTLSSISSEKRAGLMKLLKDLEPSA